MDRYASLQQLRARLQAGSYSIGSWMQLPHASIAEIMGQAGYDWIAVDMEHGSIAVHQLPDLFRALELGGALPLVRVAQGSPKDCKQALDAGSAGVIVPMIESASQLIEVRNACRWPPSGTRGVGFSRANHFGKYFQRYTQEAQAPLLVAMIEHIHAVKELDDILNVEGLDAVLIGPYDLSASMGQTAQFDHPRVVSTIDKIRTHASARQIPCGIHVVLPEPEQLKQRIREGYRFLAYSIDAVMLNYAASKPSIFQKE